MKPMHSFVVGAFALAFAQLAAAQPDSIAVETPRSGDISVEQRGIQNSQQIGSGNQSTQVYGNENQATTQSGEQNQSAMGTGNQQSQQYGEGNVSSQAGAGGTASNEQNRQYRRDRDEERKRDNQGWHKGWENNKHRDESSGKYEGSR